MRRKRCYWLGAAILVVGWLAALVIYLTAGAENHDALGYEFVDGTAYAIEPGDSKRYLHDLERFGGKAAVLADDLSRWFAGLWRGRGLAKSVAILTLLVALGCFRAGRNCPDDAPESNDGTGGTDGNA